jgi:hypothetical protein
MMMEPIADVAPLGTTTKLPSDAAFYNVYSDVESSDGEAGPEAEQEPEPEPEAPKEVTLEMLESVRKQVGARTPHARAQWHAACAHCTLAPDSAVQH